MASVLCGSNVDQMWKSFAKLCLGALVVDSSVI